MSRRGELRRRTHTLDRRRTLAKHAHGGLGGTASSAAEIQFVKLSPTGNTTVLVTSSHPVTLYRSIAAQLLEQGHLHAEQVGFVRRPTSTGSQVRLHMAGDEFCGNACMALAALTAAEHGLGVDDRTDVVLEASGADAPVTCAVEHSGTGYSCELAMPRPSAVEPYAFPGAPAGRSAVVRYPEVVHLVVECAPHDPATRERAQEVAARLGTTERVPVVGVMLFDAPSGRLAPLVNVPALSSMVWEGSCGSGTAALGAYLAARSGRPVRADVHQPGGTMRVHARPGADGGTDVQIGGQVRLVAEGTAYVRA